MTHLFAQPYNPSANGFYFSSYEEYEEKSSKLTDSFGLPVEEFEFEYIDGDLPQLFNVCSINQGNLELWFEEIEIMDDQNQVELFYQCDNLGQGTQEAVDKLSSEGSICQSSLIDYATDFINDYGIIDCLPDNFKYYLNPASIIHNNPQNSLLNNDIISFS